MLSCFGIIAQLAGGELREPLLPLWLMEMLAAGLFLVWLFCLGATVGSFINVVVYRLPRGLNLAFPGSACPRCGHPIRLQDNIPIISWLVLRGRCRDCGGVIAVRYLLVELLIACTFLLVLFAEPLGLASEGGFSSSRLLTQYDVVPFWMRYALHACLVTTAIAAVLVRSDGFRVPARIYWPVLIAGMLLPLCWPEIRSQPAMAHLHLSGWQAGLGDGLAGLVVGVLLGLIAGLLYFFVRGKWPRIAPVSLLAAVNVVLGWQWGLAVAPLFLLSCAGAAGLLRAAGNSAGQPYRSLPPASGAAWTNTENLDVP